MTGGPAASGDGSDDDISLLIARLREAAEPTDAVAGWATVELDRAEVEVGGGGPHEVEPAPDEHVLGARCRLLTFADGRRVVLLEPSTEGLIAAALARQGEGTVALYLVTDAGAPERARRAGFQLSTERPGPLGPERLVRIGPRWGPFVLLAGFA